MKKTIFPLLVVLSITGIILGSLYYQKQIATIAEQATTYNDHPTSLPDHDEGTEQQEFDVYSNGWLGSLLQDKVHDHHIVFLGSDSLESSEKGSGWPSIVMEETAGALAPVEISHEVLMVDEDTTSNQLIEKWLEQVVHLNPTILIAESLTLNDNTNVETIQPEESVENLAAFFDELHRELPDVEIILVPSNPIGQASFYPLQIATLTENANTLPVTYYDHWSHWPESAEELEPLLDSGKPTDAGQELWAKAFLEFFIDS